MQLGELLERAKWAVRTLNKWLLAHFAVRGIAGKDQMAVLGHLAVRKIARRGQMGCWDMGQMAVGTFCSQDNLERAKFVFVFILAIIRFGDII